MSLRWSLAIAGLASCSSDVSLEERPCPCASGYVCCELTNRCMADASTCALVITPTDVHLRIGAEQQLSASLQVTWSVEEANGGSIDSGGKYRAPRVPGKYHVRATTRTGASTSSTLIVGPSKLEQFVGVSGGKGDADGIGNDARFSNPVSITGDQAYVFVSDGPLWGDQPAPISPEIGECFKQHCAGTDAFATNNPCFVEHCMTEFGLRGVRRISRATARVDWLVSDRYLRPIASDGKHLFAGSAGAIGNCTPMAVCGFHLPKTTRVVLQIDRETGAVKEVAGADVPSDPIDGIGPNARFGAIKGMAAASGTVFVTDGAALREVDSSTGQVKTLATGWPFKSLGGLALADGDLYAVDDEDFLPGSVSGTWDQTIWKYHLYTGKITKLQSNAPATMGISKHSIGSLCVFQTLPTWPLAAKGIRNGCVGPLFAKWPECDFGGFSGQGNADGSAFDTQFFDPKGIWCDASTTLVADTGNATIRELHGSGSFGVSSTFAGSAADHDGTSTPGPFMRLRSPKSVTSDSAGTLFVAYEGLVGGLRVTPGLEFTLHEGFAGQLAAGPGGELYSVAGWRLHRLDLEHPTKITPLMDMPSDKPQQAGARLADVVHDGVGTVYVSDRWNGECRVFRTDPAHPGTGKVVVDGYCGPLAIGGPSQLFVAHGVPQTGPEAGYWHQPWFASLSRIDLLTGKIDLLVTPPDGWQATSLAYDPAGVLYVAEAWRHRIRGLVVETGEVFELVGRATSRGVQLGALPAGLNQPEDITLLPDGSLAIADTDENVVLVAR